MTNYKEDIKIVYSDHCEKMSDLTREKFEIQIYKADFETTWILEIVDQSGNSFVWDERFESDVVAYNEAVKELTQGEKFDKESFVTISV